MGTHSVVEAKNQLSALIDRALGGEQVTITRHGQPVVELRPLKATKGPVSPADIEWLRALGVPRLIPGPNAAELVRQMRDEDD